MKCRCLWLVALAFCFLSKDAVAERWIVKNPRANVKLFTPLKALELGGNSYVVIDVPPFAALGELRTYGEAAFPDAKIGLPPALPSRNGLTAGDDGEKRSAWHVKALQYEKLPLQFSGQGVIVAVVDTGIDYNHSALKDHVWTNEKEIPGNGVDDDGNGYVDDIHGWDFEHGASDPMDGAGHGTHCAGVIAASANGENGAQGVAPGAKVMAIRIIGEKNQGFLSDAVAGIKYAVDNGATVLSNSWRVYRSWDSFEPNDQNIEFLRLAIVYASEHGAIFVAAAGNESLNMDTDFDRDPLFPAGYIGLNNFIVVAASDEHNDAAYFTNFGATHVDLAAPGTSIISTIPNDRWMAMSGTSMAAPLVAGAVARGLSAHFPASEIGARLINSSAEGGAWNGKIRARGVISLVNYLAP